MKSKSINTNALLYNGMSGAQLKSLKLSGNSTVDMPNGTLKGNQIVNAEYVAGVEGKLSEEIAKHDKDLNTAISSLERKLEEMGAYVFKGSCTYEELPRTASIGDVYNVTNEHNNVPAGTNYAWTGEYWDELGGIVDIDLSNYYTKEEVDKDISDIENKVTDSENRLTSKIDDINSLLGDKSDELSELSDKLDEEISRSKEAESSLQTNIDTKQDKLPSGQPGQVLIKSDGGGRDMARC